MIVFFRFEDRIISGEVEPAGRLTYGVRVKGCTCRHIVLKANAFPSKDAAIAKFDQLPIAPYSDRF